MVAPRTGTRPCSVAVVPCLVALALATVPAFAQVSITTPGVPVSEDFNTLANTGTSSILPAGWAFIESGTNQNLTYTAGTGSNNAGDTYSFGLTGSAERALGAVRSGSLVPTFGASFNNATAGTITSLDIGYTGEQWRCGATGRADRIDFQYSLDATSLTVGTWVDIDALDFSSPSTTLVGALNGNLAANRSPMLATITALAIPPGATFWIRWADLDVVGADDGLSVDDFSLTALTGGVGVGDGSGTLTLAPIVPSPASGSARIGFSLSRAGRARAAIHGIDGRLIRTLVDAELTAGPHTFVWDGQDESGRRTPSGGYFVRLEAEGRVLSRRAVWLR